MNDVGQEHHLNNPQHGDGFQGEQIPFQTNDVEAGMVMLPKKPPKDIPEYDPSFNYAGYQVVRTEYFAHTMEPCISFADCKIGFNKACIKKLSNVEYVQVLVNRQTRKLVIRPSSEEMKDSFPWVSSRGKARTITCRPFFALLVDMMGWNPNYRYKLIGKLIHSQTELILVFDLKSTEIFRRELLKTDGDEEKWRTSRKPVFPDEWKDQFGLPVEENNKVFQINIYDGYAVFGLKDTAARGSPDSIKDERGHDESRLEGGEDDGL